MANLCLLKTNEGNRWRKGRCQYMEIILYLSVAIIAIAFAVLVYFVAQTLKSLKDTLSNTAKTLDSLEKQMNGLTTETTALLHKTNLLAEDIQGKSEALDTVFVQVKEVGTSLGKMNHSLKNITGKVTDEAERQSEQVTKVVQWGNAAMQIWQKWQVKKKATDQYVDSKS